MIIVTYECTFCAKYGDKNFNKLRKCTRCSQDAGKVIKHARRLFNYTYTNSHNPWPRKKSCMYITYQQNNSNGRSKDFTISRKKYLTKCSSTCYYCGRYGYGKCNNLDRFN